MITDEIVEKAAKAIFFDQHNIMHDHDECWRKSNQVIWRSGARAVLAAVLPDLLSAARAEGVEVAAALCDGAGEHLTADLIRASAPELRGAKF